MTGCKERYFASIRWMVNASCITGLKYRTGSQSTCFDANPNRRRDGPAASLVAPAELPVLLCQLADRHQAEAKRSDRRTRREVFRPVAVEYADHQPASLR